MTVLISGLRGQKSSQSLTALRSLSDRSRRQRLKNGEKGSKWSIRRYRGCDVTSMPRKRAWSLSTALYVRSTKLNYDRSKITGEIESQVRQAGEQATSIDHATSDVHKATMAKLKVERSRARGESALSYVNHDRPFFVTDGRRNARKDGQEV